VLRVSAATGSWINAVCLHLVQMSSMGRESRERIMTRVVTEKAQHFQTVM